jgi:predicted cupin superfamily sugar epimerase
MHPRAQELIATLGVAPHPEGGFYREIFRSPDHVLPGDGRGPRAALTTIYFLLTDESVSRWHRVLHTIAAGRCQAARSVGPYALVGCTV